MKKIVIPEKDRLIKGFLIEEEELAEHDAKIINKFAEELKSRLGDAIYPKDFVSMRNLIDDVAREQNSNKLDK